MVNGEDTPKAAPKSKSRIIIWVCVLLAFVAVISVFSKFMFFPNKGSASKVEEIKPESKEPGALVEIGDFLTNLSKPDEDSFISLNIAVELESPVSSSETQKLSLELGSREIELKEVIEQVLRTRNREMLSTDEGLEGMRQELKRKINLRLQKGQIQRVLTYNMIIS